MIFYSIKTTDCLQAIINCVSVSNARYWMTSKFKIEEANRIIPKLIAAYSLDLTEQQRKTIRRRGEPTWTLVLNYDPADKEKVGRWIDFWLFTTGFSPNPRKKVNNLEEIARLNRELVKKQKMHPIYTQNPSELITFRGYTLGQYAVHVNSKGEEKKDYWNPEELGLLDFEIIKKKIVLPPCDKALLEKLSLGEIHSQLKNKYGINMHTRYHNKNNGILKRLYKENQSLINRYNHYAKMKGDIDIRHTWYLSEESKNSITCELKKYFKQIVQHPERIEGAFQRLFQRGHYHGVRHQVGNYLAYWKRTIKEQYPNIFKNLDFPETLNYVRFSEKIYDNFKQFHNACIIASIHFELQEKYAEMKRLKYRTLAKELRQKNEELRNANASRINLIIKESDKKMFVEHNISDIEVKDFIARYPNMNPLLLDD